MMKKKTFRNMTIVYLIIFVVLFTVYVFQVADENWKIQLDGQRGNLATFGGMAFILTILAAINFAGINEKGNKVTKNMIYGGLSVAAFFLIWRAMSALV